MIQIYASSKKIPFRNTKEANGSKWIRITADERAINHNDKNSPAWLSPKYNKLIDQLPRDYGVGRYTPGPIYFNKPVTITAIRGDHGVVAYDDNGVFTELLCVHISKWYGKVGATIPANQPVFDIDKKERHLHISAAAKGQPRSMDTILGIDTVPQVTIADLQNQISNLKSREEKLLAEIAILNTEINALKIAKDLLLKENLGSKNEIEIQKETITALEEELKKEKDELKRWKTARIGRLTIKDILSMLLKR